MGYMGFASSFRKERLANAELQIFWYFQKFEALDL